jgi:hypothetical protein
MVLEPACKTAALLQDSLTVFNKAHSGFAPEVSDTTMLHFYSNAGSTKRKNSTKSIIATSTLLLLVKINCTSLRCAGNN